MNVKLFPNLAIRDDNIFDAVAEVLGSGQFVGGRYLDLFAQGWARYSGAKYCAPVASGSVALTAAIRAAGLPKGSLLVVPALSFAATAFSVVEAGCIPVYVDVYQDGTINYELCLAALDKIPLARGVVPVHLYGQQITLPPDILRYMVIEDACQAHGLGHVQGLAACFSFYPSKNLGAVGDAGAVVTDNPVVYEFIKSFINYGDPPGKKYVHSTRGTNARMDNVQATVLYEKLTTTFVDDQAARQLVATRYVASGVESIARDPSSWHLYPILAENREWLRAGLAKVGIETGTYYPYTLPNIACSGVVFEYTPNADFISQHVIALPIGPHITASQVGYVADELRSIAHLVEQDGWNVWRAKSAN